MLGNKLKFWIWKANNRRMPALHSLFTRQKSSLSSHPRNAPSSPQFSLSLPPATPLLRTKAEADALNSPQRNGTAVTPVVMNAGEGCILWDISRTPTDLSLELTFRFDINHRNVYVLFATNILYLSYKQLFH